MVDRFLLCLPYTLAQECPYPNDWANPKNFSNDAHDPGGKTMCGIIQREYDHWRKGQSLPVRDVRQLTEDEGHAIYENNYWNPECPKLPPGLDLQFFDEAVNTGASEATKVLQYVFNIAVDGEWGAVTQSSVDLLKDLTLVPGVVRAFTTRRLHVYQEMKGFQYFGTDWTRRANEIGRAALNMAQGGTS